MPADHYCINESMATAMPDRVVTKISTPDESISIDIVDRNMLVGTTEANVQALCDRYQQSRAEARRLGLENLKLKQDLALNAEETAKAALRLESMRMELDERINYQDKLLRTVHFYEGSLICAVVRWLFGGKDIR